MLDSSILNAIISSLSVNISTRIAEDIRKDEFILLEEDTWFADEIKSRLGADYSPTHFLWVGFDLPEQLKEHAEDFDEITATVAVFKNSDVNTVSADNCPLDGSAVGLHLNVFLSGDTLTGDLSEEIQNSVRHELEHVVQEEFPHFLDYLDYHKINFALSHEPGRFCLYLTQPAEVSAHVRGYQEISRDILEFSKKTGRLLEDYVEQGLITREEKSAVFWCWKDWYDRNNYYKDKEVAQCAK